jgi:hypothetical protein
MSNKGEALDALQTIINLAACHTLAKITDEIIKQSETIRQALNGLPEISIGGERVSCFYAGMPGHSIPIEDARAQFSSCDSVCGQCGACQI